MCVCVCERERERDKQREKHWKKASKDDAEVCYTIEAHRKVLQKKKDYHINALKSLEGELTVARQKSQESLQRAMEVTAFLSLLIIWNLFEQILERMSEVVWVF